MNKLLTAAFLTLLSSGCVLYPYDHESYGAPGDVTFSWTLAGAYCNEVPDVKGVYVHIPGETLANDGFYPCQASGFSGITLYDFDPGSYAFTLEAVDYFGDTLYQGAGSFQVDGSVRVSVDLTPHGLPTSYAYLSWTLPANSASDFPNCTQAGVSVVDVSIDGAAPVRYACASGFGSSSVQTDYLDAGSHSIELVGRDSAGYPYYSYRGTLMTYSNAPSAGEYALSWAVGGVAIRWSLINGGTLNCSQAQVQSMSINFVDSKGNLVYGPTGDLQACDSAPVVYDYLLPGTYKVYVQGTGPGGTYLSSSASPITVTVKAGLFVSEVNAVNVPLYKQ